MFCSGRLISNPQCFHSHKLWGIWWNILHLPFKKKTSTSLTSRSKHHAWSTLYSSQIYICTISVYCDRSKGYCHNLSKPHWQHFAILVPLLMSMTNQQLHQNITSSKLLKWSTMKLKSNKIDLPTKSMSQKWVTKFIHRQFLQLTKLLLLKAAVHFPL